MVARGGKMLSGMILGERDWNGEHPLVILIRVSSEDRGCLHRPPDAAAQSLLYTGLASRFSVYSRGVPLRSPSGRRGADVNAYSASLGGILGLLHKKHVKKDEKSA
jgi:hypothetical protein